MRPASLRLNVRVFSVFLVVGLLMLVAASYFVIGVGQAGLRNAGGQHLRQIADSWREAILHGCRGAPGPPRERSDPWLNAHTRTR